MDVVRRGDASMEGFKHMSAGLKALLASGPPFVEQTNGLGFVDRQGNTLAGVLRGKGETEFIANWGVQIMQLEVKVPRRSEEELADRRTAKRKHRTRDE